MVGKAACFVPCRCRSFCTCNQPARLPIGKSVLLLCHCTPSCLPHKDVGMPNRWH